MAPQNRATGYEPLNTLKPVAADIWLIDGPAVRHHGMPFPTRCTVVRLADGDLWVHSPTLLTDELRAELQALGPVRYLIASNRKHINDTAAWLRAYPKAVCHAASDAVLRTKNDPAQTSPPPWANDLDQMIVRGSKRHSETVFFHRASSTLIVTDLIQNFETSKLPALMRPLVWLTGVDDTDGKMSPNMRMSFSKTPLAESIEAMIAWNPQRLILAHGRWYHENASGELRRAFRRILRDREWSAAIEGMTGDNLNDDKKR